MNVFTLLGVLFVGLEADPYHQLVVVARAAAILGTAWAAVALLFVLLVATGQVTRVKSGPRHFGNIKRKSNRQHIREAKFAVKEGARVFAVLLAVLAQKGGDVVITQGTLDQVGLNLSTMGHAIVLRQGQGRVHRPPTD